MTDIEPNPHDEGIGPWAYAVAKLKTETDSYFVNLKKKTDPYFDALPRRLSLPAFNREETP